MKVYYNFNKNQRNFSLTPTGDCISTDTDEEFRPGVDSEKSRLYKDCHGVIVKGNKFKVFVIIYEDDERDYLVGENKESLEYYTRVKSKYESNITPKVQTGIYYRYGFMITETTYKYNDNYFIETEWVKE
jgi:hypothetical protein